MLIHKQSTWVFFYLFVCLFAYLLTMANNTTTYYFSTIIGAMIPDCLSSDKQQIHINGFDMKQHNFF